MSGFPWLTGYSVSYRERIGDAGPGRPSESGPATDPEEDPVDQSDLINRFTYHPPKEGQPERYQLIRDGARELALLIDDLAPDSREKSIAITHLEEVVMWANAAIARSG